MIKIDENHFSKTLNEFISRLKKSKIFKGEFEDPESKLSHRNPDKTLAEHIDEMLRYYKKFLKIFNLEEYDEFIRKLIIFHDLFKLHEKWSVESSKRLSHSFLAFMAMLLLEEFEHEFKLLPLLIRNHHSSIKILNNLGNDKRLLKRHSNLLYSELDIENIIYRFYQYYSDINELIEGKNLSDIGDVFGIFKLLDVLSASLPREEYDKLLRELVRPIIFSEDINEIIKKQIIMKNLVIDEKRLNQQKEIARNFDVVIAPTGWGKTNVALFSLYLRRPNKAFYILPTITAIRKMYERFSQIFGQNIGEYFYFYDTDALLRRDSEYLDGKEDYLIELNKYFIRKINITTIDQFILAFLQIGKYFMRRFSFRNSLIVFDEFHLIPPRMFVILKWIFKNYLKKYNMKFLFMSATPERLYLDELENQLGRKFNKYVADEAYKSLQRHLIKFDKSSLNENLDLIIELRNKGKKSLLIIMNTVKNAIRIYEKLKAEGLNPLLLHARFSYKDRLEKEQNLEKYEILIATQVAEVSLDVSFDVLLTELAPIPALIQRFGRVNRYAKIKPREYNVYIFETESIKPYDEIEMHISRKYLPSIIRNINAIGESTIINFFRSESEIFETLRDNLRKEERELSDVLNYIEEHTGFLLSIPANELKVSNFLRDEINVLAFPMFYEDVVRELYRHYRNAKGYKERKKILSEIKQYLLSAPIYCHLYYTDLPFPIAKADYNPEIGLRC